MTNVKKQGRPNLKKTVSFLIILFSMLSLSFFIFSCSKVKTAVFNDTAGIQAPNTPGTIAAPAATGESAENPATGPYEETPVYLFDYKSVNLKPTESIDLLIKNCNIYTDIYGDMVVLGEIENISGVWKTNIEITFNFFDGSGREIDSIKIQGLANYLQPGSRMPFYLVYETRANYINISGIKIGTNFKNYNKSFKGLPVIAEEDRSFQNKTFSIKGKVTNIGENNIEDLKIFATFYNLKNRVVFIKKCFIENNEMDSSGVQDFGVAVLLDEYIKDFTHYRFEAFFRDSVKAAVNENS